LPQPGQKTVTVSGKALTQLEDNYKLEKVKRPNLSFATFISESALIELERRKILREAQFISLVGFGDDAVILKDVRKDGRLIEVQIRNRNLKCISVLHRYCDTSSMNLKISKPVVEQVTGNKPVTFSQFAKDYAGAFK